MASLVANAENAHGRPSVGFRCSSARCVFQVRSRSNYMATIGPNRDRAIRITCLLWAAA
jgi:hypothetical protein